MVASGVNKRACHSDVTTEGGASDCLFGWVWASPTHKCCQSVTPYHKQNIIHNIYNYTLNITLMQFGLVLDGIWCNGGNTLIGSSP